MQRNEFIQGLFIYTIKGISPKRGYSEKEFDIIWDKVRHGKEWKERFGKDADSVMAKLRGRQ